MWPHLTTRNKSRWSSWDRVESKEVMLYLCKSINICFCPKFGYYKINHKIVGHHIFRESHIHPLYFYTINPQSKNTWIRKVPYKFKIRGPNFQGQCSLHPEPFPAMSPPLQHPTLCPGPLGIASAWAGKGKPGTAGTLVKQWNHVFFLNMIKINHINLNQEAILSSTRSCQNSWLLYTSCFGHTKRRKHHKPCLAGLGNWYHQNICT